MSKASEAASMALMAENTMRQGAQMYAAFDPRFDWLVKSWAHALLGDPAPEGDLPPSTPRNNKQEMNAGSSAFENVVRRLWGRGKVVHDVDETLWEELAHGDRSTVVPRALLRHLPYPDPYIAFPVPYRFTLQYDGRIGVMKGMFLTGARKADGRFFGGTPGSPVGGVPTSTHDVEHASNDVWIVTVAEVQEPDGRPHLVPYGPGVMGPDLMFQRSRLALSEFGDDSTATVTVGELIDQMAERYEARAHPETTEEGAQAIVVNVIAPAINLLVYLCAKNADLRPVPSVAMRKATGKGKRRERPVKVIEVGYNVGARLRAGRATEQAGGGAGTKRRAHIRRGHTHLYWTGKGRQVPELKWLEPTFVALKNSGIEKPTVVSVEKEEEQ